MRPGQKAKTTRVPMEFAARYEQITALTDKVCQERLDDDYLYLCRMMTATICRKRESPIGGGHANIWACGIALALARINLLFDDPDQPDLSREQLCALFDARPRSGAERATLVTRLLKTDVADPKWWRPSHMANNPRVYFLEMNGIIVHASHLTIEQQEELVRLGVIPCLPAERTGYRDSKLEFELSLQAIAKDLKKLAGR